MRTQPSDPGARAWVVFDVVSAAAVTAVITVNALINWRDNDWRAAGFPAPTAGQAGFVVAGIVISGAAVAARRWRPLLSAAVVLAAWLAMLLVAWPLATRALGGFEMISALLLYSVAVTEPLPIAAGALIALFAGDTVTVAGSRRPLTTLAEMALTLVLSWGLGVAVARYREAGARLRQQQDAAARAELDRERMRLARELHDVLAHSMSVVNVQAGYGRFVIGRDPAAAEAALAAIQEVSREAMTEMRGMLAVLRDGRETAALTPPPRLADVPRLIATCAEARVRVRYQAVGAVRDLPDGVELAAFRIAQEALTNVVKHAHTRSAQLLLDYQDTALVVTVTDAGRGGPAPAGGSLGAAAAGPGTDTGTGTGIAGVSAGTRAGAGAAPGGGHGLAGMAEWVSLYDGTVTAGPLPGGGWRVQATLPCPPPPASVPPPTGPDKIPVPAGAGR